MGALRVGINTDILGGRALRGSLRFSNVAFIILAKYMSGDETKFRGIFVA